MFVDATCCEWADNLLIVGFADGRKIRQLSKNAMVID